jgi:outer membrane protein assembly factor BamD
MLGEALLGQGNALQAVREFRRAADDTPNDPLAPQALLRAGDAYASLWRRPELDPTYGRSALATYQEVVNRFPSAPAAQRAQARVQGLQDQFAYKDYKAGMYYIRLKAYDSAILYFRDVVATYPRSAIAPDVLIQLIKAYTVLGYQEDVRETCGYIRRFHANAAGVSEVCPPLAVDSTATGAS